MFFICLNDYHPLLASTSHAKEIRADIALIKKGDILEFNNGVITGKIYIKLDTVINNQYFFKKLV